MIRLLPVTLAVFAATPLCAQEPERHLLTTSDGVEIPAWSWGTAEDAPWVLLFHQGGSSGRAEYAPIVPRVRALGFRVLTIDQRRGGDLFDGRNGVAARFDAEQTSYCAALPDLRAALDFAVARDPGRPVVLWGSSYSAALAIRLAAERADDLAGVLAFSPASGDPMEGCRPEPVLSAALPPLLVVRPSSEMEYDWIAAQLATFADVGAETWVSDPGRHGSSTLVDERVGSDTATTWAVVSRFLRGLEFPARGGGGPAGPS